MKKLAFGVSDLAGSQINYCLIKAINEYQFENHDVDLSVFFEQPSFPVMPVMAGRFQFAEAFGYNGTTVATSLATAQKFLSFPAIRKRFFSVWDLEWIRRPADYFALRAIYANPLHQLIARSEEHAKAIENAWNVRVDKILPDPEIGVFLDGSC